MTDRPQNKNLKPIQPGEVRNPHGRHKGSRNKLGEAFLDALHDDFAEHGVAAIQEMRSSDPSGYVRVIAMTLPKELQVTKSAEMDEDELDARILEIATALEIGIARPAGAEKAIRDKGKPH